METIYRKLGPALKTIRLGKGYTQKYVVKDLMSRSALAKIEKSTLNPTFTKFSIILKQLEMDSSEFEYVANNYQNTSKNEILTLFSRLSFSTEKDKLTFLQARCQRFNNPLFSKDIVVTDIGNICQAILFLKNNELSKAKKVALPIWERLSKQDTWYLLELRMLNNILYLLSPETAVCIVKLALNRLEDYNEYITIDRLKASFVLNLIQIKFLCKHFDEELKSYCRLSIDLCQKLKLYDLLAVSYIRYGIVFNDDRYLSKGFRILESIEQIELKKALEKETMELKSFHI